MRNNLRTTTPRNSTSPSPATAGESDRKRLVPRARPRPNGRALVGALLVTLAAVGAFAIAADHHAPPQHAVVVAGRALAPGERLAPADLDVRLVSMPDEFDQRTFSDPAQIAGAAMLAPLAKGEILQRSAVLTDPSATDSELEFSFPIDRDRAMNGELRPGETIDLLATYGSGIDAVTTVLARRAVVLGLDNQSDGTMGGTGRIVMTIGLASSDELLDAVHAAQVANLTAVRSTRAGAATAGRDSTSSPASSGRSVSALLGAQR